MCIVIYCTIWSLIRNLIENIFYFTYSILSQPLKIHFRLSYVFLSDIRGEDVNMPQSCRHWFYLNVSKLSAEMCARVRATRQTSGHAKTANYTLATNIKVSLVIELNIHSSKIRILYFKIYHRWNRKNHSYVPAYIRSDYISYANHAQSNHELEPKHPPVSPAFFDLVRTYRRPPSPGAPCPPHSSLYACDCFFPLDDICYRQNKPWKRGPMVSRRFLSLARSWLRAGL